MSSLISKEFDEVELTLFLIKYIKSLAILLVWLLKLNFVQLCFKE